MISASMGRLVPHHDLRARCLHTVGGRFPAPALFMFYFLLSGHERCHFPLQNLAPSNRYGKWSISSAQPIHRQQKE